MLLSCPLDYLVLKLRHLFLSSLEWAALIYALRWCEIKTQSPDISANSFSFFFPVDNSQVKNNEVVTKITPSLEVVERRRQHSSHLGLPDTVQVFGKRFQVEMWIFSVSRLSSSNFISQHNNTFESALQGSAQRFTPLGNKRVELWREPLGCFGQQRGTLNKNQIL